MIGVLAPHTPDAVVREFFELFKTPWEGYRAGQAYDVVLSVGSGPENPEAPDAGLCLVFASEELPLDRSCGHPVLGRSDAGRLGRGALQIPIRRGLVTFSAPPADLLTDCESGGPAAYLDTSCDRAVLRVGYDLFAEVRTLLVEGQSAAAAAIPTLDLHIEALRGLITGCGVSLVEVPPVPSGYAFAACLTHDVDHASIRKHGMDRTVIGFLHRATTGSFLRLLRGRLTAYQLLVNLMAAFKLPFVHMGLARDFWADFDRYRSLEGDRPSTFFVLPSAGYPGRVSGGGPAPSIRRSGYGAAEIQDTLRRLQSSGSEIGLHGIDAWLDAEDGRREAGTVASIASGSSGASGSGLGVRMHWLYSDRDSPRVLDEAGFSYDSTVGYNETVGYRAGTSQVFRPLNSKRLLELPMHVMDTALFFRGHLDCSEDDAWRRIEPLLDRAVRSGGVLTFNWHDRSIAPERLWGDFYERLVGVLSARGAWFATAGDAVDWFRMRRSIVFEETGGRIRVKASRSAGSALPGLCLRSHPGGAGNDGFVDRKFTCEIDVESPGRVPDPSPGRNRAEVSGCL